MFFKNLLIIVLISVLFKCNLAYDCRPCTCETTENSVISASCSSKITEHIKLNGIPQSIQTFPSKEEIGELDFNEQNFEELKDDLSNFSNVENVVLSHNLISKLHPNALKNLTHLKTLYLDNNKIPIIPLEFFQNNVKIEHIFLHNNKITSLATNVFANLPNLAEVHLNQNNIKRIENNCFFNVPLLNTLDLSNNSLSTLSLNFMDHLDSLVFVYFDKNPWVCDVNLCDLINTSLEKKWSHGRVPECFHANGMKTNRNWEDLQILESVKILQFESPIDFNQTVVLTCQVYVCSFPLMFWNFNGTNLENSTHCIDGHKHTLTNVLNGINKDDEGLYTCLINNCSFCANSSRYLTVIDVDFNVETTTWEEETNTSNKSLQYDTGNLPVSDVAKSDISLDWPCPKCLIIGIFIGIFIGIIIGIIIAIPVIALLLPICCCGPRFLIWIIKKLNAVVDKIKAKLDHLNEENSTNDNEMEMGPLNAQ